MRRFFPISALLMLCLSGILFSGTAFAIQEKKWPDSISGAVDYLVDYSKPENSRNFSVEKCIPLLSFITGAFDTQEVLYNGGDTANPSAFYHFDLKRNLEEIIQYGFNPEISSVLLRPSSVRLSYWSEVGGEHKNLPKLWQYLSDLNSPVEVRGTEHIEITPDTNSGTYFSYDMNRTFILFKHQGKKVMISLSHQKEKSEVGKKGLILGPDKNWNYVYTGEKGVNKAGLGWVRSRIYKSNNIMIFYENSSEEPSVRCAVFNWIKAGWAGVNMVNNQHIYNGIIRFASDFKTIIESSTLPTPNELAHQLARFETMPTKELRNRTRRYLEKMEDKYAASEKQLAKLLSDPDYVNELQREEMISMLIREYTKVIVGKQPTDKADFLLGRL